MRWFAVLALAAGCSFEHGTATAREDAVADTTAADAPPDMAVAFCQADPHLRLCFSFDVDPLPTAMPNEGAANVSATLTGVTRGGRAGGGDAELTAASMMYVPFTTEVTGIRAIEIMFRGDMPPPTNFARVGLFDSNVIPPNISLFWYRNDPGYQLRCGLGSALYTFDAPIVLGSWHYVLCTCTATDTLELYLDSTRIGEVPNAQCTSGGAFVADGLTIGSNNNGGPTGNSEWLVGAVDAVRLWDVPQAVSNQL